MLKSNVTIPNIIALTCVRATCFLRSRAIRRWRRILISAGRWEIWRGGSPAGMRWSGSSCLLGAVIRCAAVRISFCRNVDIWGQRCTMGNGLGGLGCSKMVPAGLRPALSSEKSSPPTIAKSRKIGMEARGDRNKADARGSYGND